METVNTLIVGGGQAGLAISHCLTTLGRDHLIIERGRVAERWHSERWDSLRLLTPNWMTRLPGFGYRGPDPDGFMSAREVASFFAEYASSFDAPIREHTTVLHLATYQDGFAVTTSNGAIRANNVVIATGWCDRPAVPGMARHLPARIHQVVPSVYRNSRDLPPGGVLVVGASATGVQLADELRTGGRDVTLAVGNHSRLPRRHRGIDIFRWLEVIGSFDKTVDHLDDVSAGRTAPSLQLVGRPDHRSIDLATLQASGVRLVGHINGVHGARLSLATDVRRVIDTADRHMACILARIDAAIERLGLADEMLEAEPNRTVTETSILDLLDLDAAGVRSIVWATGYRRPYPWLDLPILDSRGEIAQYRGVTAVPGAYVLGQRFQHYQNSNFIDGVGRDAQYVAKHISRRSRHLSRATYAPLSDQKRAQTSCTKSTDPRHSKTAHRTTSSSSEPAPPAPPPPCCSLGMDCESCSSTAAPSAPTPSPPTP
jgi:putative flavoprotein involved in K+ transport